MDSIEEIATGLKGHFLESLCIASKDGNEVYAQLWYNIFRSYLDKKTELDFFLLLLRCNFEERYKVFEPDLTSGKLQQNMPSPLGTPFRSYIEGLKNVLQANDEQLIVAIEKSMPILIDSMNEYEKSRFS